MAFVVASIVAGGIAVASGGAKLGMALSGRKKRKAEQKAAKAEMEKYKREYKNLDTSNLNANVENQFTNQENTYEDLKVNTKQAEFEGQQMQQSQANLMSSMGGAAGGSGIAALAQAMSNQGQLQRQQAGASIGMQESQNQRLQAGEASKLQNQERQGEVYADAQRRAGAETARGLEWDKTSTLLGMSQQRTSEANKARAQAKAQQMSAVGDIGAAGMDFAMGSMKAGAPGGGGTGSMMASDLDLSKAGEDVSFGGTAYSVSD